MPDRIQCAHPAAAAGPKSVLELAMVNPKLYKKRRYPTFTSETSETLGIVESPWEPLDEYERGGDKSDERARARRAAAPLSLPGDLGGYQPLRLWFALPHPANEMNDEWFEVLVSTLRELAEEFATSCFGAGPAPATAAQAKAASPWADPALSPALLYYASEAARKDNHDGGWDALLADPRQRAYVAQGVLARVLDEHVFSALLFGGTASQQDALAQWDRIMIKEEAYKRKFKRCEEVQYFLAGRTVTAHFWAEVDRVTAQTAALLLPLLNIQRRMAAAAAAAAAGPAAKPKPTSKSKKTPKAKRTPSLPAVYQRLHDVVALAGYASLCMAWSTSIFQVEFPELGQLWEVDQARVGDQHVYGASLAKAAEADGQANGEAGGGEKAAAASPPPSRAAKVKIALWPRVVRYKPRWDSRRTALRGATRTVLSKSHNAYYSGRVRDAHEDAEDWPDLAAHVAAARRARRRAAVLWWVRRAGMAVLGLGLVVWIAFVLALIKLSKTARADCCF